MIVTNGLILYWNSKQGVNGSVWENIAPATKGNYNGTIFGNITVVNEGMLFASSGERYIELPTHDDIKGVNDLTMEYIIKENDDDKIVFCALGDYADEHAGDGYGYYWFSDISRTPRLQISTRNFIGGVWKHHLIEFSSVEEINQTLHVTVTIEGNILKDYINGSLVYTEDEILHDEFLIREESDVFYAGSPNWNENSLDGTIDSIRFYNRALTEQEVIQNYNVGNDVGLAEIKGVIMRKKAQTITIPGEIIEGAANVSFRTNGDLYVNEFIEGESFSFSSDHKLKADELIEGVDLDGST